MSKPKHNAYRPEQVTDGIVTWTQKHFDLTKRFTPEDQAQFIQMMMAGSPAARIEALAQRLLTVADHPNPAVQMHVASIRASLDALSRLRTGGVATFDEMERLNQADQQWIKILILRDAMPLVRRGAKFPPGRKPGAVGPIRKAVRRLLKNDPTLKNADLWELVKDRLPRGWTAFDNRTGRYLEKPSRPEQKKIEKVEYSTFCNIAADERRALKDS